MFQLSNPSSSTGQIMALLLKAPMVLVSPPLSLNQSKRRLRFGGTKAFFNPTEDPIIKDALKEPVAFLGGMFAGLLRLDLKEDPLKDWITKTVEASGITVEETENGSLKPKEEAPQQIEIE